MAQIIRSAKHSLIQDLITGRKTLTSPVITSATGVTSLTAPAATEMTIVGSTTKDVEVTLGDKAGVTDFHVADSAGVELFKIPSTGIMTLEGGATIDNSTSATTLTITETNIDLVGAVTANSVSSDATITATTIVNTPQINDADADTLKINGEVTSRNAADNSMYVPVAASLGHERLWKVAGKVTANDGGYFEALYVNAATSTTATLGRIVGTESKVTINANMDAGATAEALYAKISVANASEVANAYGLYVEMEESGSGAITQGTGVYVKGGDGIIDYAIDVAQDYRLAAIKLPSLAGAAITAATIAGAGAPTQGAATGDTGLIGLYKDSADSNAISAVFKYDGLYYHVKLTDTTDS